MNTLRVGIYSMLGLFFSACANEPSNDRNGFVQVEGPRQKNGHAVKSSSPSEMNTSAWRRFEEDCLLLRAIEERLRFANDASTLAFAEEAAAKLQARRLEREFLGSDFYTFYRARVLIAMNNAMDRAESELRSVVHRPSIAPEALVTLGQVLEATGRSSLSHENLMAILLPSTHSRVHDGSDAGKVSDRPVIPMIRPDYDPKVTAIADRYFQMRLFDSASRAYQEAIYGSFPPPYFVKSLIRSGSWLSRETGKLWLQVSRCEAWLGNTSESANFLAKSIVFGSDEVLHPAIMFAHELDTSDHSASAKPQTNLDQSLLKEIAELYAEMNMHPRSIEVLRTYRETIGKDAEALQEKYQREWETLVRAYCVASNRAVLFGKEVYSKERGFNFDVTIPPPLRPEALEEVRKAFLKDRNQK